VLSNMEGVIAGIVARCTEAGPLHHPPAAAGPPPRAGEDQVKGTPLIPPRNGEGDRAAKRRGGGAASAASGDGAIAGIPARFGEAGPLHQPAAGPPPRAGEDQVKGTAPIPPRNGEGDRDAKRRGGGAASAASGERPGPLHHEQVNSAPHCSALSGGQGDLLISAGPPPRAGED
jgi:hypothetical protein